MFSSQTHRKYNETLVRLSCRHMLYSNFASELLVKYIFAELKTFYANLYKHRIQTWALEEARRRLEAEGILEDPEKAQKQ
jgi:hypothetical protein